MRIGPGGHRGVGQLPQRNLGMGHVAQADIDVYVNRAAAEASEALSVDGIEFDHWRVSRAGAPCTCQNIQTTNSHLAPNLEGALTDDSTPDPAQDGELDYVLAEVRDRYGNPPRTQEFETREYSPLVGQTRQIDQLDGLNRPDIIAQSLDRLARATQGSDLSAFISNSQYVQCGICFGTGFIDGYQLSTGRRFVFDLHDTSLYKNSGWRIDLESRPYRLKAPAGDSIVEIAWPFTTPAFFDSVELVGAFENLEAAPYVDLFWFGSDTLVAPLSVELLAGFKGKSVSGHIVARPACNGPFLQEVRMSHVSIVYKMRPSFRLQMGQLSQALDYTSSRPGIQTNLVLPPSLSIVAPEDVIYERKHHGLWKLTSVTDSLTAKRQIFRWDADCRLVKVHDPLYGLRGLYVPLTNTSFEGYRRVQGVLTGSAG